jgi:DNA invertase Pin-like site-specific DNA recombinase
MASKRAAIYARITFLHDDRAVEALDLQVAVCRERGRAQGYIIQEQHIYRETDGWLDLPREREVCALLFAAAERHEFDVLLIYTLDRLVPRREHKQRTLADLSQLGITIETISE